jgi:hypothetical protein
MNSFHFILLLLALLSQIPNCLCLGKWTWMYGEKIIDSSGNYGIKGESSDSNIPSSRYGAPSSFDKNTNTLWLFGGYSNIGKK